MPTLHVTINQLAATFAHELLAALRNASLDEIIAETRGGHVRRVRGTGRARGLVAKGGRRSRRTEEDLAQLADRIVALVAHNPKGVNAETMKRTLKIERKELPRPLLMALQSKKIRKKGHKRATLYFKA